MALPSCAARLVSAISHARRLRAPSPPPSAHCAPPPPFPRAARVDIARRDDATFRGGCPSSLSPSTSVDDNPTTPTPTPTRTPRRRHGDTAHDTRRKLDTETMKWSKPRTAGEGHVAPSGRFSHSFEQLDSRLIVLGGWGLGGLQVAAPRFFSSLVARRSSLDPRRAAPRLASSRRVSFRRVASRLVSRLCSVVSRRRRSSRLVPFSSLFYDRSSRLVSSRLLSVVSDLICRLVSSRLVSSRLVSSRLISYLSSHLVSSCLMAESLTSDLTVSIAPSRRVEDSTSSPRGLESRLSSPHSARCGTAAAGGWAPRAALLPRVPQRVASSRE